MKYVLWTLVTATKDWQVPAITNLDNAPAADEARRQSEVFDALMAEITESGELLANYAFFSPEETRTVQVRGGEVIATDGPFGEATEQASGVFVLEVTSPERMLDIAQRFPAATNNRVVYRPVDPRTLDDIRAEALQRAGL